jgi:hypothetical protein
VNTEPSSGVPQETIGDPQGEDFANAVQEEIAALGWNLLEELAKENYLNVDDLAGLVANRIEANRLVAIVRLTADLADSKKETEGLRKIVGEQRKALTDYEEQVSRLGWYLAQARKKISKLKAEVSNAQASEQLHMAEQNENPTDEAAPQSRPS